MHELIKIVARVMLTHEVAGRAAEEQLGRVEAYLERQTDLAYLAYRRAQEELPGRRFSSVIDALYQDWIDMGDAQYRVRDIRKQFHSSHKILGAVEAMSRPQ